jgi:ribosomal protein L37AE/L43A
MNENQENDVMSDYEKELLKLPICPKCKHTDQIKVMLYLIPSTVFCCTKCNIEWSQGLYPKKFN